MKPIPKRSIQLLILSAIVIAVVAASVNLQYDTTTRVSTPTNLNFRTKTIVASGNVTNLGTLNQSGGVTLGSFIEINGKQTNYDDIVVFNNDLTFSGANAVGLKPARLSTAQRQAIVPPTPPGSWSGGELYWDTDNLHLTYNDGTGDNWGQALNRMGDTMQGPLVLPNTTNTIVNYTTNTITAAATIFVDLATNSVQFLSLAGNSSVHTTNRIASGAFRGTTVFVQGAPTNCTLTLNTNWIQFGTNNTVLAASNKWMVFTFGLKGTAESDVVCTYDTQKN